MTLSDLESASRAISAIAELLVHSSLYYADSRNKYKLQLNSEQLKLLNKHRQQVMACYSRVKHPTPHIMGHFGDNLRSHSLDWCENPAGWLRGTVVECRSLASELSLSCARPAADR